MLLPFFFKTRPSWSKQNWVAQNNSNTNIRDICTMSCEHKNPVNQSEAHWAMWDTHLDIRCLSYKHLTLYQVQQINLYCILFMWDIGSSTCITQLFIQMYVAPIWRLILNPETNMGLLFRKYFCSWAIVIWSKITHKQQ